MKNQQPAFRVTATLEENNKSSSEVIMPMGLKPEDRLTLMPFTDKESSIGNPRNNQVIPEGCEPGPLPWKHSEDINRKTAGIVGAIPIMTTPLAVICLLLNIVIPGTGTVLSGLTLLCRPVPLALAGGVGGSDERLALVCLNLWVGLAQLFTVTFLLIGWVWSITWGVIMLSLSSDPKNISFALTEAVIQLKGGAIRTLYQRKQRQQRSPLQARVVVSCSIGSTEMHKIEYTSAGL